MATETKTTWQRALIAMSGTFLFVVVIVALYWGKAIFLPLTLAIVLTFVLSPLATLLQRKGLGHIPSVAVVVGLTILVLVLVSWVVVKQTRSLLAELPEHTEDIKLKIQSVRDMMERSGGGRLTQMFDELSTHIKALPSEETNADGQVAKEAATVVVVKSAGPPWLTWLSSAMGQVVEFLTQFALAVVLFMFMLAKRADLRNRFIRLAGLDRMTVTTRAVDDAGQRVSRFLVAQATINAAYGLAIAVGLFVLGVQHAFLWGFLAGVLRYAPYVGAPLAALFPITQSLAFSPGWLQPILVVALVVVLEFVFANLIEPWQFGQSMGVSEVAQLTAAAFWAFLWGPIGLVLSGPLTVCLLVLGKYVPQLEFLEILLGDQPPLTPAVSYYQRLMAHDQDEAAEIVQGELQKQPAEKIYDELLIPALCHARADLGRGGLSVEDERFIAEATREILEEISGNLPESEEGSGTAGESRVRLLLCPARDLMDQVAAEMFQHLLTPEKWDVHLVDSSALAAELIAQIEEVNPSVICIGSLPPGTLAHTRYLCKRLRKHFPNIRILVGRWGQKQRLEEDREKLKAAGADHVEATLQTTRDQLDSWCSVLAQDQAPTGASRARLQPALS